MLFYEEVLYSCLLVFRNFYGVNGKLSSRSVDFGEEACSDTIPPRLYYYRVARV